MTIPELLKHIKRYQACDRVVVLWKSDSHVLVLCGWGRWLTDQTAALYRVDGMVHKSYGYVSSTGEVDRAVTNAISVAREEILI